MKPYTKNKEDYDKLFRALKEVRLLTKKLYGSVDMDRIVWLLQMAPKVKE
jgi:hypothetical protein